MPQYMLVFCLFVCVFECFLHIQNVANLKKKATLKKKSLISSSNIYLGDFVFSFSSLPTIGGVTHNSLPFQSASFPLTEQTRGRFPLPEENAGGSPLPQPLHT